MYFYSQVVILTKFKLTNSLLMDKTIFPAWERDRTGKKSVSEDRERQISERRAWECDRVQLTVFKTVFSKYYLVLPVTCHFL